MTKGIGQELATKNIRCNVIAPGPVWTPLVVSSFPTDSVSQSCLHSRTKFTSLQMKGRDPPHAHATSFRTEVASQNCCAMCLRSLLIVIFTERVESSRAEPSRALAALKVFVQLADTIPEDDT